MNIEKAIELKAELDRLRPLNKEQETKIMQKFRLDWDYHSNHLEGNQLTFGETKALILFGITAQGKPLQDHIEITGHDEAIKWILDIVKKEQPLTEHFIRQLHHLLLKEPYEKDAITPDGKPTKKTIHVGEYKKDPNHVKTRTGEIFYFATPQETPTLMHDLIEWYRQQSLLKDVNPILLAAEFHYKFIRIHPFDDGNGRTARILMNFILMEFGYPPVIIKTEDKVNYFAALQQADSGQLEPFVEYIAKNLVASIELMIAGAKGENIDDPEDFDKQIALLTKKMKFVGENTKVSRNKDSLLELYDNSLKKFLTSYIKICEKFNSLYNSHRCEISVMGSKNESIEFNEWKTDLRKKINDETKTIIIRFYYNGYNQITFGNGGYNTQVIISFDIQHYSINLQLNSAAIKRNTPRLSNSAKHEYGVQLSDQKIDELVKYEFQNHTDSIERFIENIQKK